MCVDRLTARGLWLAECIAGWSTATCAHLCTTPQSSTCANAKFFSPISIDVIIFGCCRCLCWTFSSLSPHLFVTCWTSRRAKSVLFPPISSPHRTKRSRNWSFVSWSTLIGLDLKKRMNKECICVYMFFYLEVIGQDMKSENKFFFALFFFLSKCHSSSSSLLTSFQYWKKINPIKKNSCVFCIYLLLWGIWRSWHGLIQYECVFVNSLCIFVMMLFKEDFFNGFLWLNIIINFIFYFNQTLFRDFFFFSGKKISI